MPSSPPGYYSSWLAGFTFFSSVNPFIPMSFPKESFSTDAFILLTSIRIYPGYSLFPAFFQHIPTFQVAVSSHCAFFAPLCFFPKTHPHQCKLYLFHHHYFLKLFLKIPFVLIITVTYLIVQHLKIHKV